MTKEDNFSFDDSVAEIERIIEKLENEDVEVGLDSMVKNVEKALELTKKCKERLCYLEEKFDQYTTEDQLASSDE